MRRLDINMFAACRPLKPFAALRICWLERILMNQYIFYLILLPLHTLHHIAIKNGWIWNTYTIAEAQLSSNTTHLPTDFPNTINKATLLLTRRHKIKSTPSKFSSFSIYLSGIQILVLLEMVHIFHSTFICSYFHSISLKTDKVHFTAHYCAH